MHTNSKIDLEQVDSKNEKATRRSKSRSWFSNAAMVLLLANLVGVVCIYASAKSSNTTVQNRRLVDGHGDTIQVAMNDLKVDQGGHLVSRASGETLHVAASSKTKHALTSLIPDKYFVELEYFSYMDELDTEIFVKVHSFARHPEEEAACGSVVKLHTSHGNFTLDDTHLYHGDGSKVVVSGHFDAERRLSNRHGKRLLYSKELNGFWAFIEKTEWKCTQEWKDKTINVVPKAPQMPYYFTEYRAYSCDADKQGCLSMVGGNIRERKPGVTDDGKTVERISEILVTETATIKITHLPNHPSQKLVNVKHADLSEETFQWLDGHETKLHCFAKDPPRFSNKQAMKKRLTDERAAFIKDLKADWPNITTAVNNYKEHEEKALDEFDQIQKNKWDALLAKTAQFSKKSAKKSEFFKDQYVSYLGTVTDEFLGKKRELRHFSLLRKASVTNDNNKKMSMLDSKSPLLVDYYDSVTQPHHPFKISTQTQNGLYAMAAGKGARDPKQVTRMIGLRSGVSEHGVKLWLRQQLGEKLSSLDTALLYAVDDCDNYNPTKQVPGIAEEVPNIAGNPFVERPANVKFYAKYYKDAYDKAFMSEKMYWATAQRDDKESCSGSEEPRKERSVISMKKKEMAEAATAARKALATSAARRKLQFGGMMPFPGGGTHGNRPFVPPTLTQQDLDNIATQQAAAQQAAQERQAAEDQERAEREAREAEEARIAAEAAEAEAAAEALISGGYDGPWFRSSWQDVLTGSDGIVPSGGRTAVNALISGINYYCDAADVAKADADAATGVTAAAKQALSDAMPRCPRGFELFEAPTITQFREVKTSSGQVGKCNTGSGQPRWLYYHNSRGHSFEECKAACEAAGSGTCAGFNYRPGHGKKNCGFVLGNDCANDDCAGTTIGTSYQGHGPTHRLGGVRSNQVPTTAIHENVWECHAATEVPKIGGDGGWCTLLGSALETLNGVLESMDKPTFEPRFSHEFEIGNAFLKRFFDLNGELFAEISTDGHCQFRSGISITASTDPKMIPNVGYLTPSCTLTLGKDLVIDDNNDVSLENTIAGEISLELSRGFCADATAAETTLTDRMNYLIQGGASAELIIGFKRDGTTSPPYCAEASATINIDMGLGIYEGTRASNPCRCADPDFSFSTEILSIDVSGSYSLMNPNFEGHCGSPKSGLLLHAGGTLGFSNMCDGELMDMSLSIEASAFFGIDCAGEEPYEECSWGSCDPVVDKYGNPLTVPVCEWGPYEASLDDLVIFDPDATTGSFPLPGKDIAEFSLD